MQTEQETLRRLRETVFQPSGAPNSNRYAEVLVGTTAGYTAASPGVTFGGTIPQWGRSLRIICAARIDAVVTVNNSIIQFNGDTGNNYVWQYVQGQAGVASAGTTDTQPGIIVMNSPGTLTTANYPAIATITIPLYSGSTFTKETTSVSHTYVGNSTAPQAQVFTGLWKNTVPITSIKINTGGGNFVIGSWFGLYIDS